MVANAHLVQEAEGKKLFDLVYLVGVIGMILALGSLPFVLLLKTEEGIHKIDQCRGRESVNDKQVLCQGGVLHSFDNSYFSLSSKYPFKVRFISGSVSLSR